MSQSLRVPWRSSDLNLGLNFEAYLFSLFLKVKNWLFGLLGAKTASCFVFSLANISIDFLSVKKKIDLVNILQQRWMPIFSLQAPLFI